MKSSEMSPAEAGAPGGALDGAIDGEAPVANAAREDAPTSATGCAGFRVSTCGAGDFLKNEKATEKGADQPERD